MFWRIFVVYPLLNALINLDEMKIGLSLLGSADDASESELTNVRHVLPVQTAYT